MTTTAPPEIASLRDSLPMALKREQIVQLFDRCGLGGLQSYKKLKSAGTLIPLRGLSGAKQARFSRDDVLAMCAEALKSHPRS